MRGRILNARTPDEVFYDPAIRIPVREPDESFAYLFFDLVKGGRIVGNNGVQHERVIYRLTSLQKHLEYWGERVDVRVNPDDQRVAMIFDRRTGAYVCKALADEKDATYDTRDAVTRDLIARVFGDGKHLLRMAKEYVDGAEQRLIEYRRAKIEYLVQRSRVIEAERRQRLATLTETNGRGVTVIGSLSQAARDTARENFPELSADIVSEVLAIDEAAAHAARAEAAESRRAEEASLCVVSTRHRAPKRKPAWQRCDGALRFSEIAAKLGKTRSTLHRYLSGVLPWPDGLREQFEYYARLRSGGQPPSGEEPPPVALTRRKRRDGDSYANIAKALGVSRETLRKYRTGARPWPEGMRERFEELERLR